MQPDFFEFSFKSAEYLTEASWQRRWQQFFLIEIRKSASHVIRELAELLPEWRSIRAISKDDLPNLNDSDRRRLNEYHKHLYVWQKKYGLDADQKGEYAAWVAAVVDETFRTWDKYDSKLDDLRLSFEAGGVEMRPLEHAMAQPDMLVQEMKIHGMDTEEEAKQRLQIEAGLRQLQEEMRRAVEGVELILPPPGFPSWYPVFQTKKNYLMQAEHIVEQRIINDPILRQAERSAQRAFIKAVLESIKAYCQRLAKHYEKRGYKKPPNIRAVEQEIAWTVQVQVLGRHMSDVAHEANNHLPRVQSAVHRVLKNIDLALRKDITPGRPKQTAILGLEII